MFPHLDRNANIDVIRRGILGCLSKVFLHASVKIAQLLSGDTTFWFGVLQSLHRSGLSYEPGYTRTCSFSKRLQPTIF